MSSKAALRKNEAVQQLIEIEKEFEELRSSNRFISFTDSKKPESLNETNWEEVQNFSAEDKDTLQLYGMNLTLEEIEKISESEPWSNGFHAATTNLIKRYDFLRNSYTSEGRLDTPTEENVKAFNESGIISQAEITDLIEGFKISDAMAQARENLISIYSLLKDKNQAEAPTTNDIPTVHGTTEQVKKPDPKEAGAVSEVRLNIPKRKIRMDDFVKLDTVADMAIEFDESDTVSTSVCEEEGNEYNFLSDVPTQSDRSSSKENSYKLGNFFQSFLSKRTDIFMFPQLHVTTDGNSSTDADDVSQYKNSCLKLATNTSVNAVEFCKKSKVACAMLISIFEELFCLFQRCSISSFVENQYGKILMMEIFSELYVLECEIVEQKRRCIKFLIDANIFLYHDPPLSKDNGSWTDQQRYMWQLAIIKFKLCIQQFEVLISKLNETQTEFIAQYKAFMAFCKLSIK